MPSGWLRALVVALVLLVAGVLALFLVAGSEYRASLDRTLSLDRRLAAAQAARGLAPWDARYRIQEMVMAGWVSGRNLLESGDYSGAVRMLRDAAYLLLPTDPGLVALYHRASDIEALATTRKAHLQHGHEGPGSTLRPQDVER